MRPDISKEEEELVFAGAWVAKLYQIIVSRKKDPIIEMSEPKDETVFQAWKLSG